MTHIPAGSPVLVASTPDVAAAAPDIIVDEAGQRRTMRFVLVVLFLNAMAFGIVIPVMPGLVMELGGVDLPRATAIGGWLAVTFAVHQFLFAPIIGNLSDRFGRRPVLLASLFGFAVDFLILALASDLIWLFIARALTGVFGASNGPAQAVIADITPPGQRASRYGLISATFGVGFIVGPALGGALGELGLRVPFYAAAALALGGFCYGLLGLPETLARDRRRPFRWARANAIGALGVMRRMPGIGPVALVFLLWQVASLIYPLLWTYHAAGRFGWSPGVVGASLALVGAAMAVVQIFGIKPITARMGDERTAMLGLIMASAIMAALAFNDNGAVAMVLIVLMGFQSVVHPCLMAIMTRRVSASNQGEVQGFASGVMALGSIVAPLVYNPLHARFTGANPPFAFDGITFAVAAALALAALVLLRRIQIPPSVTG